MIDKNGKELHVGDEVEYIFPELISSELDMNPTQLGVITDYSRPTSQIKVLFKSIDVYWTVLSNEVILIDIEDKLTELGL